MCLESQLLLKNQPFINKIPASPTRGQLSDKPENPSWLHFQTPHHTTSGIRFTAQYRS